MYQLEKFCELLDTKLNTKMPLKIKYSIDQAIEHLTNQLKKLSLKRISIQSTRVTRHKQHIEDKRKVRKVWQTTRALQDKSKLNRAAQLTGQSKRILISHNKGT